MLKYFVISTKTCVARSHLRAIRQNFEVWVVFHVGGGIWQLAIRGLKLLRSDCSSIWLASCGASFGALAVIVVLDFLYLLFENRVSDLERSGLFC